MATTATDARPAAVEPAGTRMLTPTQVYQLTGIAVSTLTNWRSLRKGPPWVKVSGKVGQAGGRVRYPEQDLYRYLAALPGGDR